MSRARAVAYGMLAFLGLLLIAVLLFSGNASATPHAVITIEGDADLIQTAIDESWNGTGTVADPYIIENCEIDAGGPAIGYGILIKDTTLNVTIRGCSIENVEPQGPYPGSGILIQNALNITVHDTSFSDVIYWVHADMARYLTITECYGWSGYTGFYITGSSFVLIEGSDMTLSTLDYLMVVSYSDNLTITDCQCSDLPNGIGILGSSYVELRNITAWNLSAYAISVIESDHVIVSWSNLSTRSDSISAMQLTDCDEVRVHNNTVQDLVAIGISGNGCENVTVSDNAVDRSAPFSGGQGISFTYCGNFTMQNNSLTGLIENGIYLYRSWNGVLSNNTVTDSNYAIYLVQCSLLELVDNTITGVMTGVIMDTGNHCAILRNSITGTNAEHTIGIVMVYSDECLVGDNDIGAPIFMGISIEGSQSVSVFNNTMTNTTSQGIFLKNVHDGSVSYNTITWTETAIYIESGYDLRFVGNVVNNVTNDGINAASLYDAVIDSNVLKDVTNTGIEVRGTISDSNLTVSNNHIASSGLGIVIMNAALSHLAGNDCPDFVQYGIRLWNSPASILTNNTCSGEGSGTGLELYESDGTLVMGGIYEGAFNGIRISGSSSLILESVNASFNSNAGLAIGGLSDYSTISNSTFSSNINGIQSEFDGYPVWITIQNCRIENNLQSGMILEDGFHCYITSNLIANNALEGVYFDTMSDSVISNNTFVDNNGVESLENDWSQVFDGSGSYNSWYDTDKNHGNAWSNLKNLDRDGGGIVDLWYRIGSNAGSIYDKFPLPYGPRIEAPSAPLNLTATVDGWYVHLEWEAPLSLGNSTLMDYAIYYSEWPELESMTYLWNAEEASFDHTAVENGHTYYYAVIARNVDWSDVDQMNTDSATASVLFAPFPVSDHLGIFIPSDLVFAQMADDEGWQGDGSAGDPYVIENYVIDGANYEACIKIMDTTAHFIIRNCTLYQGSFFDGWMVSGIVLYNAINGRIENCSLLAFNDIDISAIDSPVAVVGCHLHGPAIYGVYIESSSGSIVTGSVFENKTNGYGIYVTISNDCQISFNTLMDVQYGIFTISGQGNAVHNNTMVSGYDFISVISGTDLAVRDNSGSGTGNGLSISGTNALVEDNTFQGFALGIDVMTVTSLVRGNLVTDCYDGMWLRYCADTVLLENNISSNRHFGTWLRVSCTGNIRRNNLFLDNLGWAIVSDGPDCSGNTIFANLFDGNHGSDGSYDPEFVQAYDDGNGNVWYDQVLELGNLYSDWPSPDLDGDGIVDLSYQVGVAEDLYPLARSFGPVTGAAAIVTPTYVNLTWNGLVYDFSEGINGFVVLKQDGAGELVEIGRVGPATFFFVDDDVVIGTTYQYRIAAYLLDEIGALGDQISATPCDVPGAPADLMVEAGLHAYYLSWSTPADEGGSPILGYIIWRGESQTTIASYGTVGTTTSFTDLLVGDNETWYYAVAAFNQAGDGSLSATVGNTTFGFASAPLNVTTQFGNGNVTVHWDAPLDDGGTPITCYVIEFGIYPDFSFTIAGADDRSCLITGLTNGLEYSFRVLADNIVLIGYYDIDAAWSSTVCETPATVPDAPEGLEATTATGLVRLSWLLPTDDGGSAPTLYSVSRMEIDGEWAWIGNSTTLMYEDNTVSDGVVYFYRVSAVNKAGEGNASEPVRAVPGLPSPPTVLIASNSAGKVQLNWTAPADNGGSDILGYKVYRNDGLGFVYLGLVSPASLDYLDTTAAPGIEHAYRVTAISGNGEGSPSNVATITLPMSPPEAPIIDSAVQRSAGAVIVWHVPESSTVPVEFLVYRGASAGSLMLISMIGGNLREYLDISGAAGMFYALRSSNQYGIGDLSETFQATLGIILPPEAPQGLTAIAGDSLVTMGWFASDGAVGYHIYRDDGTGYALLTTVTETDHADGTVVNGITCSYRVTAFNDGGESDNSSTVLATPGTVPGAVQNLTLTEGEAIVTLNWEAPSNDGGFAALGYRVYRDLNGTVTMLAMVSSLTYSDHAVVSGLLHTYWIVALNDRGAGPESVRLNVTPDDIVVTGLPAPSYLLATVGNGSVTLNWDPMTSFGVDGFVVLRSDGGNFSFLAALSGSTYTDTGLVNGATYTYRVHCFIGTSKGENASVDATPGTKPGSSKLNGLIAVDRISLSWSVPENGGSTIIGYRLYRTPGTGTTVLLASLTGTTYVDTAVLTGVNYTYMVTAFNAFGEGAPSNALMLRTSPQISPATESPAEPYLSSVTGGNASISLLWNVPSDPGDGAITGYNVYRGTSPLAAQLLVSVPAGTTTYVDGTAVYGTTYYYWVSALNQWGESDLSRVLSASLVVLAAPGEVDIDVDEGQGRITLSWSAPDESGSSITEYRIYRRGETGDRQLIATVPAGTDTFVDGSVEAGSEYDYWVTAVNAGGEGPFADTPVSGVPLAMIAGEAEVGPMPMVALALGVIGLLVAMVAVVLVLRKK